MRYGVHKICPRWPAVTLTFNLQNLIRSSVGLINIPCKFHRDCSSRSRGIVVTRSVWMNGQETNMVDGQPENIMPTPTGGDGIKTAVAVWLRVKGPFNTT